MNGEYKWYDLTKQDEQRILQKQRIGIPYYTNTKVVFTPTKYGGYVKVEGNENYRCFCKMSNGRTTEGYTCKYCGSRVGTYVIPKSVKMLVDTTAKEKECRDMSLYKPTAKIRTIYYIKKNPDDENSIIMMKVDVNAAADREKDSQPNVSFKIVSEVSIVPNGESVAVKKSKKEIVPIDMFETFPINSQTMKNGAPLVFDEGEGVIDYMLKNKSFSKCTGFMECFNNVDVNIPRNIFFMIYMYLYAQYPVIEFVAKMGHMNLLNDIMRSLSFGVNKADIKRRAENLNKVLNQETTKGSLAFTVPKFIADDLRYREAKMDEYVFWGDIVQLEERNGRKLSKENYENFVNGATYFSLRDTSRLDEFSLVMTYGYKLNELGKYIESQLKNDELNNERYYLSHYLNMLKDYMNMADLIQVEPDKFPKSLLNAHNHLQMAYQEKANEGSDQAINLIANAAERFLPKTEKYLNSDYVIVIPRSVRDVVQEGQNMHNCVGSYVQKILMRRSFVFFIRKKDTPQESLVTAEYAYGGLNQIYYKNNTRVTNQELIDIGQAFCQNMKNGHFI